MEQSISLQEQQVLISRCRQGDQQAQFCLYKQYYRAMYNVSMRIVNSRMEAEDIIQESFLAAFDKLDTFNGASGFGSWLKKIVVNRSIDTVSRRRLIFEDLDDMEMIREVDDGQEDYELSTDGSGEQMDLIRKGIYRLPDGYRIVLTLYLLEGYDHDEIAQILKINPSTSRSQYSRARRQLSAYLSRKMPMAG